jgi:hypothetical protein
MHRRNFLKASLAASALTALPTSAPAAAASVSETGAPKRDYYELRAYRLREGAAPDLLHGYLEHVLIPALNARGIKPVGVFDETEPKEGPTLWVLIPHPTLESVAAITSSLNADATVQASARDYFSKTTKDQPAYKRIDSWLHLAFSGMPRLEIPELSQKKAPRVVELRTYESYNEERALKKVAMFNAGEIEAMHEVGLAPIFFGQALVGQGLPQLTYMLSGPDRAAHAEHWKGFNAHPVWVKLRNDPIYAETVSHIVSRFLTPTAYSQL